MNEKIKKNQVNEKLMQIKNENKWMENGKWIKVMNKSLGNRSLQHHKAKHTKKICQNYSRVNDLKNYKNRKTRKD